MRVFLLVAAILSVLTFGAFFYLSSAIDTAHGTRTEDLRFTVNQGENVFSLAARLESAQLISSRFVFTWHLAREGKTHMLVAGTYILNGNLTVREIATMVTEGKVAPHDVRVTFPEGWDNKKLAARLTANGLPGADFLLLVTKPDASLKQKYDFLADLPTNASLEGYLFPDTYYFDPEASAETIVDKMLTNFGKKVDAAFRSDAVNQKRTLFDIVTLASVVENEVQTEVDRKIVADIFLRRLAVGHPLQSDATLQYVLGEDKIQHSYAETRTVSPYNTYMNPGLPPGPISNPGIVSLQAVLYPQSNNYFYFLTDVKTGKTIFSVTYEEHLKNKNLYGL